MKAFAHPALLAALALVFISSLSPLSPSSRATAGDDWSPLLTVRFGNIDAIDAEDGELALFIKAIRNDNRFLPPMRTLVGPELRNPTFFGAIIEAWLECMTMVPALPGPTKTVWILPVESREEYLNLMTTQGLSEYEGMDGVTLLRELTPDGNTNTWYLQWLPGNVVVFGFDRDAVMAARKIYAERSAARGLLYGSAGGFANPDVTVRVDMSVMAAWQDRETGRYWWRERIDSLVDDMMEFWKPEPARRKVMMGMADALAIWPRGIRRLDVSAWFESDGIEWRVETEGDYGMPRTSLLKGLRAVPDRAALATARPVTPASFAEKADWIGELILSATGGVVTREARETAESLYALAADGGIRESVVSLVSPPVRRPELGGCRLWLTDWQMPEQADAFWRRLKILLGSDQTLGAVFTQTGLRVEVEESEKDPDSIGVRIFPAKESDGAEPYYQGVWTYRRKGTSVALVMASDRQDEAERIKIRQYHADLASEVVEYDGEGGPDVRAAFTGMGPEGASWLGFIEPVRFLQFCLIEAADWSPRSPDQLEPLSTQLAREMLEYGSGRAWTAVGDSRLNQWRFDGRMTWDSLARLAAALGITETLSM